MACLALSIFSKGGTGAILTNKKTIAAAINKMPADIIVTFLRLPRVILPTFN
jgi:hypothetical protein